MTILYAIVSLVATIGAFLWEPDFGIFTLALCIVLVGIYINSTYQRYKRLTELASDINSILHGDDIGISLEQYSEGELGVLQSEIHKMTNRLREQKQHLLDDKVYLADSLADISHQMTGEVWSGVVLGGVICACSNFFLFHNFKAYLHIDAEHIKGRYNWFGRILFG